MKNFEIKVKHFFLTYKLHACKCLSSVDLLWLEVTFNSYLEIVIVLIKNVMTRNLALCFEFCFRKEDFEWFLSNYVFDNNIGEMKTWVELHKTYLNYGMNNKKNLGFMFCTYIMIMYMYN